MKKLFLLLFIAASVASCKAQPISTLPAASTLTGSEVFPVVQSSITRKARIDSVGKFMNRTVVKVDTVYNNANADSLVYEINTRRHALPNKALFGVAGRIQYFGVLGKDTSDNLFKRDKYSLTIATQGKLGTRISALIFDTTQVSLYYQHGSDFTGFNATDNDLILLYKSFQWYWPHSYSSHYALVDSDGAGNLYYSPNIYYENNGKVGMGTVTPQAKLDVNGTLLEKATAFSGLNFTNSQFTDSSWFVGNYIYLNDTSSLDAPNLRVYAGVGYSIDDRINPRIGQFRIDVVDTVTGFQQSHCSFTQNYVRLYNHNAIQLQAGAQHGNPAGNVIIGNLNGTEKLSLWSKDSSINAFGIYETCTNGDTHLVGGVQYTATSPSTPVWGFGNIENVAGAGGSVIATGDPDIITSTYATNTMTGDLNVTGKITATGGVDPPYVSYSDQTHKSIINFSKSCHDNVMQFWCNTHKRMEIYIIKEDQFYTFEGIKLK